MYIRNKQKRKKEAKEERKVEGRRSFIDPTVREFGSFLQEKTVQCKID